MPLMSTCRDCNKIIPYSSSRCPECEKKYNEHKKQRIRDYDKYDRKNVSVYHDKRWLKLTAQCKRLFNGIDIYQLYINKEIVTGSLSHHIEEVSDNKDRQFDITNLIWLSDESHKIIHSAYNKSDKDKAEMQELLFSLIEKWIEEYSC